MTFARPTALAAALLALSTAAQASQPGESKSGPQTEHVAAPINLVPARAEAPAARRPVPMAVMTYEMFEATVDHADHADLTECPKALAKEGRFCRLALHDGALHVFAFSEDLDQPLQAVLDIPVDEIRLPE